MIPASRKEQDVTKDLMESGSFVAELYVPEGSSAIGQRVRELDQLAEENDVMVVGLVRRGDAGLLRWFG